jgi:hypothetical protein
MTFYELITLYLSIFSIPIPIYPGRGMGVGIGMAIGIDFSAESCSF